MTTRIPSAPCRSRHRAARAPRALLWRVRAGWDILSRRSPLSAFWGFVALAIILMALAAPLVAPYDPLKSDFRAHDKPPAAEHFFGTDQIGRDTLSRVIYGARTSLTVAFGAVLFGTTLGSLWGLACGYFGGRFDLVSQRIIEFLQSFPDLILAMAIAMAIGTGLPRHRRDRDHPDSFRRPRHPLGGAVAEARCPSWRRRAASAPRICG